MFWEGYKQVPGVTVGILKHVMHPTLTGKLVGEAVFPQALCCSHLQARKQSIPSCNLCSFHTYWFGCTTTDSTAPPTGESSAHPWWDSATGLTWSIIWIYYAIQWQSNCFCLANSSLNNKGSKCHIKKGEAGNTYPEEEILPWVGSSLDAPHGPIPIFYVYITHTNAHIHNHLCVCQSLALRVPSV